MMLYIVGLFGVKNWCSDCRLCVDSRIGVLVLESDCRLCLESRNGVLNLERLIQDLESIPFHMYTWLELKAVGSIEPCAKG
ncbi:hypothetical protein KY285_019666 [Solanum tuberosum]|nr:hypothetical protein KY285_019666 [Solanum tuberosum]